LENCIKAGYLASPSGLEGNPLKALISQWTLIKEFENNITQIVLYQPPEQPAKTEETTVTKKKEQQELFRAYVDFLYQYRTTSTYLLQSITKGARYAFSYDKIKLYDPSHQEQLERKITFTQRELQKFGHFPSLTTYPSDHPFTVLISYYAKEQKAILLQREPPARDSTFLPKLYFETACQRTLDDTLLRYETIIRKLLDSDFNEENHPALYQIAINQQQAYKHKIGQENKPDSLSSLLQKT